MDADESRVVEETRGVNADTENGLCQFIVVDPLSLNTLIDQLATPGTNYLSYHCFPMLEWENVQTDADEGR